MKRPIGIGAALCCICACLWSCGSKDRDEPRPARRILGAASGKPALLATLPAAWRAPQQQGSALGLALHSPVSSPNEEIVFAEQGGGVAFAADDGSKVRVFHDGRPGKPYAAVGQVVLSPDGRRCAYGALAGGRWRMVLDGVEGEAFSAVKSPVFSLDGSHLAYQAMRGESWHLVVDGKVNGGTRTRYLGHQFSGDASRIAFIDDADDHGRGRLVISDLAFEHQTVVATGVSSMLLNVDGTRMAVVSTNGDLQSVLTLVLARPELAERGAKFEAVHGLVFGSDGVAFAYIGYRFGKRIAVLEDAEEMLSTEGVVVVSAIRPGKKALGALVGTAESVHFRQFFSEPEEEEAYAEAEGLQYSDDGRSHAYAARRGDAWFLVANGNEGPPFDRVVSPLFSPGGKFIAYRARSNGRRFVVVADTSGRTIGQHPAYEQVFPVHFTADGKAVAYGVKDGQRLLWRVEPL